jgi:hypothetical protein
MVLGGEHVHDRHGRVLGELGDRPVRAGAYADRVDVAREDDRGVADRLAARELQLVAAQDDRAPAELADADLEGHARARRRPLEDERDAASLERPCGQPIALELERAIEQRVDLGGGELLAGEEMARHLGIVSGQWRRPGDPANPS